MYVNQFYVVPFNNFPYISAPPNPPCLLDSSSILLDREYFRCSVRKKINIQKYGCIIFNKSAPNFGDGLSLTS